jgi:hypothetical protein
MSAPIGCNATVAMRGEEEHLIFKSVGAQRPAMAEYDWLSGSPVVVIDLGTVFCRENAHSFLSYLGLS